MFYSLSILIIKQVACPVDCIQHHTGNDGINNRIHQSKFGELKPLSQHRLAQDMKSTFLFPQALRHGDCGEALLSVSARSLNFISQSRTTYVTEESHGEAHTQDLKAENVMRTTTPSSQCDLIFRFK